VAEARNLPLLRWGEELRRHRAERRAGRMRTAATASAAILVTVVTATMLWPPRPAFVWNGSASSPMGLYHVTAPERVARGDMVVAWPPDAARRLAAERRYLPSNVPLVKRVAAAAGDRICAAGEALWVNGEAVASRRLEDAQGRPLPMWNDCQTLAEGEFLLLMPQAAHSFDGRYFGVTERRHLVGRARLIWAR
jgi:conjugative transfer signal peptidase TraF